MEKKKEREATPEQSTIDEIVNQLDVSMGILITADERTGVSMSAASRDTLGSALASQWMSQISEIVLHQRALANVRPANKIPV